MAETMHAAAASRSRPGAWCSPTTALLESNGAAGGGAGGRACVQPGMLKLGCLVQPGCWQGLETTLTMPGSLCVEQNRPRALPAVWKLGWRMQPSAAQCRLVTLTMPLCLCLPARAARRV